MFKYFVSIKYVHRNFISMNQFRFSQQLDELQNDQNVQRAQLMRFDTVQPIKDQNDQENPFIFETKYGFAKLINSPIPMKQINKIQGIYYIDNKVSTNYVRKLIKHDKHSLILFDPQSNYQNVKMLLQSSKKMIDEIYFGDKKRVKNPFRKCTTNKEIFDLHRRILVEKKNIINRILVMVDKDGSLRLRGDNVPQTKLLKNMLVQSNLNNFQYQKHDFLISANSLQGMISAENYEKNGIPIEILDDKKIYPLYGVWTPTSQEYLKLLIKFIENKKHYLKHINNAIDLGSGTGILGITMLMKSGVKKMYSIDKNQICVQCSNINAQIFGVGQNYSAKQFDLSNYVESDYKKLDMPSSFEIILANPPWIPASYLNESNTLDNGIYDPDMEFLKAILKFSSKNLSSENSMTKKGVLLLIYSDMAEILGLQQKNSIETLCSLNNLKIVDKNIIPFQTNNLVKEKIDPLRNYKNESKIILYEIQKI